MRIGTWNMELKGDAAQTAFLLAQNCDVLLLTEVPPDWTLSLSGYDVSSGGATMGRAQQYAAVASRPPMTPCSPPHPASAAAIVGTTTNVSSILPWPSWKSLPGMEDPWQGDNHAAWMAETLNSLGPFLRDQKDLVWGGDWNQSIAGRQVVGSGLGRASLLSLVDELRLSVPTAALAHRAAGACSIDHIAVRGAVEVAQRVVAQTEHRTRLSDHDFYVVVT